MGVHNNRLEAAAGDAMSDAGPIGLDLVRERQAATLRAMVGQGRPLSVEVTSLASNMAASNIKSYRAGESMMGTPALLNLSRVIGPPLPNALFELVGMGGLRRLDNSDAPAPAELLATMLADAAVFAECMVDGRLDHQERPLIARRLRALIGQLEAFMAGLDT